MSLFALVFLIPLKVASAEDLVLMGNGQTDYQIVIPDKGEDAVVDRWLTATAGLMQAAFKKNNVDIEVVHESEKTAGKLGIYMGNTEFAKQNGVKVKNDDWSYAWKTVGKDLVIAGQDQSDSKGNDSVQLALVGSVKGTLEFMREFLGTRFLFYTNQNLAQRGAFREDGTVPIDTKAIFLLRTNKFVVPSDLDVTKTPGLQARQVSGGNRTETFYTIANNYLPKLRSIGTEPSMMHWDKVIALEKYAQSHPDYYALLANGKRASERDFDQLHGGKNAAGETALCPTHPDVQSLMVKAVEDKIAEGYKAIEFMPLDSFLMTRCNCDRCNAFFGMTAKNNEEVHARAKTGKMWNIYFDIAKRIKAKHPEIKLIVWSYQEHGLVKSQVTQFPDNVIPRIQFGDVSDFDDLEGIHIPAGIGGLEETFTGFEFGGPYAPQRNTDYAARIGKAVVDHNVKWTLMDGGVGYERALSAPAMYVYGRIIDDPNADREKLEQEFYDAAFGAASGAMKIYFRDLHNGMQVYSNLLGQNGPGRSKKYGSLNYIRAKGNKWIHQSIYTAQLMDDLEQWLRTAESMVKGPDEEARIKFIRKSHDYVVDLSRIFTLEDSWKVHPSDETLQVLMDKVDTWHNHIAELSGGKGKSQMKPLEYWPEMVPFNGHPYAHVALQIPKYQNSGWNDTAIAWDTELIRKGVTTDTTPIEVVTVSGSPAIDSKDWENAQPKYLYRHEAMPEERYRTELRVMQDADYLYVRIKGDSDPTAAKAEKDLLKPSNEQEALKQIFAEVLIQPEKEGPIYRFAGLPTEGSRYDALIKPGEKSKDDTSWNPQWEFAYAFYPESKDPEATSGWIAWFKIPFSELGGSKPKKGDSWKFNAIRTYYSGGNYLNRTLRWKGQDKKDPLMGDLVF